jgi:hypothetical protein
MTALQGKYSVNFTSYEKWMHTSESGEFFYPLSIDKCMKEVRKDIDEKIRMDKIGTFNVISFLRNKRGVKSL